MPQKNCEGEERNKKVYIWEKSALQMNEETTCFAKVHNHEKSEERQFLFIAEREEKDNSQRKTENELFDILKFRNLISESK